MWNAQIIADAQAAFNSDHGRFDLNHAVEPVLPPSADDSQTIEWAKEWLHSEHALEAAGTDRFPTAVAIAIILRSQGLSEFAAEDLCHRWNYVGCSPILERADIGHAVRLVYSNPVAALALANAKPPDPQKAAPA